MPVWRVHKHTKRSQFRPIIESDGLYSYHMKFGSSARRCVLGCKWTLENANALDSHSIEADSATHPSQVGFIIKDELSDYRFLVDTGSFGSILPPSRDNASIHPSSSQLVAANGTSIVNRMSASVSLVGHTLGPTSLLTCVIHYSALTSYHTSTWW